MISARQTASSNKLSSKKGLLWDLLTLAATIAVLFVVFETGFRARAFFDDRKILSGDVIDTTILRNMESATLGEIIRLSGNDRIIYELKPGLRVRYAGAAVSTNGEGFRDIHYQLEKAKGAIRVVGVGDSVMFGQAIPDSKDYLSFLEEELNGGRTGRRWEVVNTAVPGYNTAMEVETLKEKGLPYAPDAVVVGYVENDTDLPNFIKNKEDYFTLGKSFFRQEVARLLKLALPKERTSLVHATGLEGGAPPPEGFGRDPSKVPAMYGDMVGMGAVYRSLEELKRLSEKEGFEVIAVFFSPTHGQGVLEVMQKCRKLGFHVVDIQPALARYMEENGIEDYAGSTLAASPADAHPSAFAHKMAADIIFGYMEKSGLAERLASRGGSQ